VKWQKRLQGALGRLGELLDGVAGARADSYCGPGRGRLGSPRWKEQESNRRPIASVNYTEILEALRELVACERIEFLPLASDTKPVSP
jgi:hypothetical protein